MFSFLKSNFDVINVNDIDSILSNIDLIDIREISEYKRGHIKHTKNIPMGNLLDSPDKFLKKDKKYYIMCQSGGRSKMASSKLSKLGFDIVNVAGGYGSYLGKFKA
ncbi:rhodanese-like domain-containing protein [uncultured Clostridium sp.]|uniref:rhodanese-like domain-containing protein n=1 Tax=uncultured Clostridium sp. TaxID=59620 RepID=UPI00261CAB8C|nr:rhodanese-like domain-containing protein [uncultured Clostridium sp.]